MKVSERDRFNTNHPDLCSSLRWKGIYVNAPRDPSVPPCNDGNFWCVHTQTCIGPDGKLAEPGNCLKHRACHASCHSESARG